MNVSATFTSQLMSSHTTRMTQVSIEIVGNLHFPKFGMLKPNIAAVENLLSQIKVYE